MEYSAAIKNDDIILFLLTQKMSRIFWVNKTNSMYTEM